VLSGSFYEPVEGRVLGLKKGSFYNKERSLLSKLTEEFPSSGSILVVSKISVFSIASPLPTTGSSGLNQRGEAPDFVVKIPQRIPTPFALS